MKIVIDINEEDYKKILANADIVNKRKKHTLEEAVLNGTPLPKGHGRLIDGDELDGVMYHEAFEKDTDLQKWDSGCWVRYKMFENKMADAPTIIEADKEE